MTPARGKGGSRRIRSSGRRGRTLVELVVAIPLLALGGAAVAGLLMTGGGLLLEAERRLEVAMQGPALLDSLTRAGQADVAGGTIELPGGTADWEWDGRGTLRIFLPLVRGPGEGDVEWILEARPVGIIGVPGQGEDDAGPEGEDDTAESDATP